MWYGVLMVVVVVLVFGGKVGGAQLGFGRGNAAPAPQLVDFVA